MFLHFPILGAPEDQHLHISDRGPQKSCLSTLTERGFTAHKYRSSSLLGSCSQVREEWSGRQGQQVRCPVHQSVFVLTTYGHQLWVMSIMGTFGKQKQMKSLPFPEEHRQSFEVVRASDPDAS